MPMRYDELEQGDELDHLLRSFFRAEMPNPWPPLEEQEYPAVLSVRPPQRGQSPVRGRLALAASVALLVAGSFFLADRFLSETRGPAVGASPDLQGPATSKRELKDYRLEVGPKQPDETPDWESLIEGLPPEK